MTLINMENIQQLVRRQLGARSVAPSDRLAEDLGAESADLANIVAAAEEQFGAEIAEEEIARIVTVSDLYNIVAQHAGRT